MAVLTGVDRFDLTRHVGTEFRGVQLKLLDDAGIEEVMQLAAERCVVHFRDQDMDLAEQVAFGRRLGELHIHPAASAPEGFPEVLVIHADADSRYNAGGGWHTDVSCDLEPPGYSILKIDTVPSSGGDTIWANMYEAWDALSEPMRNLLSGLTAVHTGDLAYRGRYEGRDQKEYPVSEHPIGRTHPRTGRQALYVNSGFTSHIKGLTKAESRMLLDFLFEHISNGVRFQSRFRWEPNTVSIWDNRCAQHYAIWDYFPETRSGNRVTTKGERPFQRA